MAMPQSSLEHGMQRSSTSVQPLIYRSLDGLLPLLPQYSLFYSLIRTGKDNPHDQRL